MITVIAIHDPLQPLPNYRYRVMHLQAELPFDGLQLCYHPLPRCRQAGANQVSVITSSAEREASIEFGRAATIRPNTLGTALREIAHEPAVANALFEILETQKLLGSEARLTLLAAGPQSRLMDLLAAEGRAKT